MSQKAQQTPISFTNAQRDAIEQAFTNTPEASAAFSEKVRSLVASGLALYQIEWPEEIRRGGKREGAGRKKRES